MAERIEAEITLGYREFSAGVDAVVRETQKLGQGVERGLSQVEQRARAAFSQFAKEARAATTEYQQFAAKVTQTASQISLGELENKLKGIAQSGAQAFGSVLTSGANFEEGLLRINTIAGLSQDELAGLGEQLKNVGREIGVSASPTQTLASYYDVLSSGFTKTADATKVLNASLKLAAGGQAEASDTTRTLTGILNAYGDTSEKAQLRADQLFQTVNLGVTTVPELSKSLGLVTSTAASAGVSFEELSAAIATATLRGQTTSSAIEGIRGVIGSLISPTAGAQKEFARLGITVNATTLAQDGLLKTLQKIQTANGGQVDSLNKIIEGQVGLATALALTKDGGDAFAANLDKIGQSAGANQQALDQVNKGVNESAKAFGSSVERLKITASDAALPIQSGLLKALTGIVDRIALIPKPVLTATLALSGFTFAVAGLAGTAAGLAFVLPTITGQLTTLGARVVPLATASFRALNVPVGFAARNLLAATAAMIRTNLTAAVTTASTLTLRGAYDALNASLVTSTALISGVGLGIGALVIGLGVLANAYINLQNEVNEANEAMLKSEDLSNFGRKVNRKIKTNDVLGLTGEEARQRGVTSDDVTQLIKDNILAAEQAREAGDKERERKTVERVRRLKELRSELAEANARVEQEAAKSPAGQAATPAETDKERRAREAQERRERRAREAQERREAQARERDRRARREGAEFVAQGVAEAAVAAEKEAEKAHKQKLREEARRAKELKAAQAKAKKEAEKAFDEASQRDDEITDQGAIRNRTAAADAARSERELAQERQSIYAELAKAGAASQSQLRAAIEDTLRLRLQEIEAERQLALQQAASAEEVAAAERKAGIAKVRAQNDYEKAIKDASKALDRQKAQSSAATNLNLGGGPYSLDQFIQGQQGFLDLTKSGTGPGGNPREVARQRRLLDALGPNPTARDVQAAADIGAAAASQGATKLALEALRVEVVLYDQAGNTIPSTVRKATVNGKNSDIAQQLRGL